MPVVIAIFVVVALIWLVNKVDTLSKQVAVLTELVRSSKPS